MSYNSIILKACGFRTLFVLFTLAILCVHLKYPSKSYRWQSDPPNLSLKEAEDSFHKLTYSIVFHKFIVPPANPETPLNLQTAIWKSPITKQVVRLLNGKRNGFFVEAGALDGKYLSNSIELEVKYGWQGLLVEPDPKNFAQLLTKNRKAWTAPVCLAPYSFPQKIGMVTLGFRALSNIPKYFPNKDPGQVTANFDVQCFPLFTLLQALNRTSIDYLSLDIEGAELSILQTIPFDKVSIKVISVELNNRNGIINFMVSKGYRLDGTYDLPSSNVRDAIFYHEDLDENTESHMIYKSI